MKIKTITIRKEGLQLIGENEFADGFRVLELMKSKMIKCGATIIATRNGWLATFPYGVVALVEHD